MKYKLTTWGEFKAEIERRGIKDDEYLDYMDIRFPREEKDEKLILQTERTEHYLEGGPTQFIQIWN